MVCNPDVFEQDDSALNQEPLRFLQTKHFMILFIQN